MTKAAHRYEELAEYARERGYPNVTGAGVQNWTKHDLIPPAQPRAWGFGHRSIAYPVGTGKQLLALCRLRYGGEVRDLAELAALLWIEEFEIPIARVRDGLSSLGDLQAHFRRAAAYGPRERQPDALRDAGDVAVSAVYDRHLAEVLGHPEVDRADLVRGAAQLLGVVSGSASSDPTDEAGPLAVLRLLAPGPSNERAGRMLQGSTRPSIETLAKLAERLRAVPLPSVIAAASDEDLVLARDASKEISAGWLAWAGPQEGPIDVALESTLGRALVVLALLAERHRHADA